MPLKAIVVRKVRRLQATSSKSTESASRLCFKRSAERLARGTIFTATGCHNVYSIPVESMSSTKILALRCRSMQMSCTPLSLYRRYTIFLKAAQQSAYCVSNWFSIVSRNEEVYMEDVFLYVLTFFTFNEDKIFDSVSQKGSG